VHSRPAIGPMAIVLASLAIVLMDLVTAAVCSTSPPPASANALDTRLADTAAAPGAPWATPSPSAAAAASAPDRLRMPTIGVDAHVEVVGTAASGTMDVPRDARDLGWYSPGVRPGQPGDAVIDGHPDWYGSPAVFADLGRLKVGDPVIVVYPDGTAVTFRVVRLASYPFDQAVPGLFSREGPARLTLVTGSGAWDGRADQRLVVDAEPA